MCGGKILAQGVMKDTRCEEWQIRPPGVRRGEKGTWCEKGERRALAVRRGREKHEM